MLLNKLLTNVQVSYFKLVTIETENDQLDFIKPYKVDQTHYHNLSLSCQIHTDPLAYGLALAFINMSTTSLCPPDDAL